MPWLTARWWHMHARCHMHHLHASAAPRAHAQSDRHTTGFPFFPAHQATTYDAVTLLPLPPSAVNGCHMLSPTEHVNCWRLPGAAKLCSKLH